MERDPNQGLVAAAKIMPAIDMPGVNMPHFRELADVVRRAGIYGPRDYLRIVDELIKYWSIDTMNGLNDLGRMAQEKIMGIPARLERIADIMEQKTKPKSFAFDVIFNRVFAME
jgi:acyl-[acyl-carrier-protein] desaturase